AKLADLPAQSLRIFASVGPVSRWHSHLSFLLDWRRGGRSRGAPENSTRVAVRPDGERWPAYHPGGNWSGPRVADPLPFVRFGLRSGLWRSGVPGVDPYAGGKRGHAERHCAEFDSVQRRGHGWSSARRASAGEAGREVVLWTQRAFLSGAHRVPVPYTIPVPAGEGHGIDVRKPEAGDSFRSQAAFDGSVDHPGVLNDGAEHALAHLPSRFRERHFPSRAGNLRQSPRAHGTWFDLWLADYRGCGQHQEKRAGCSLRTCLPRHGDFRVCPFEVAAAERYLAGAGRRIHDGGFCHGELPGAVDYN